VSLEQTIATLGQARARLLPREGFPGFPAKTLSEVNLVIWWAHMMSGYQHQCRLGLGHSYCMGMSREEALT
jgi:hypothetical protein